MAAIAEVQGLKTLPAPRFVAGHSLGEYTALVTAGSLSFPDAMKLVRERGRLMQEAGQVREGGMAAILGLDVSTVEQLCQQTGAEIANNNSDGQIVISGAREAVIRAIDLSRIMGARKAIPLVVSGAFHSSLMQPAVPGMREALDRTNFLDASVPVIGNCTAEPLSDTVAIHDELVQQICRCVQWARSVEFMANNGVENFVEIGPGKVLTGLVKRIARNADTFSVGTMNSIRTFVN
jgi:[acyl-carrier-protein] S-malonyltransferase